MVNTIIKKAKYFFAGYALGLMTLAPFSAIQDFFAPGSFDSYDPASFYKWPIVCGILTVIFYNPDKSV